MIPCLSRCLYNFWEETSNSSLPAAFIYSEDQVWSEIESYGSQRDEVSGKYQSHGHAILAQCLHNCDGISVLYSVHPAWRCLEPDTISRVVEWKASQNQFYQGNSKQPVYYLAFPCAQLVQTIAMDYIPRWEVVIFFFFLSLHECRVRGTVLFIQDLSPQTEHAVISLITSNTQLLTHWYLGLELSRLFRHRMPINSLSVPVWIF